MLHDLPTFTWSIYSQTAFACTQETDVRTVVWLPVHSVFLYFCSGVVSDYDHILNSPVASV